jgi:biotin operon repressor
MENETFASANAAKTTPAVGKAVRILKEVAAEAAPLGVSELARRLDISKSTVHATVGALTREGFLVSDHGHGYLLGPELMQIGWRAQGQSVISAAESVLREASLEPGETIFLGQLQGVDVIITARRESAGSLNLSAPLGSRVPVGAGALGKAFHHRGAPNFATERSEYLAGVAAAATSFMWFAGTYFIWIVGIDSNYDEKSLSEAGARVLDAATNLLGHLGRQSAEETNR